MDISNLVAGTPVLCRDETLGTLIRADGRGAQVELLVQPTGSTDETLLIPSQYVASVANGRIELNISCAEATRIGRAAGSAAAFQGGQADVLRVPVVEEKLVPVINWQEAGVLEVSKQIRTSVEEMDVPVQYEEATVERVRLNRVLQDGETPVARQDGDVLIVPVVHEEITVVKRRVLVEELRISKQIKTRTEHISEEVQREEVNIAHQGLEARATQP